MLCAIHILNLKSVTSTQLVLKMTCQTINSLNYEDEKGKEKDYLQRVTLCMTKFLYFPLFSLPPKKNGKEK